MYIFWILYILWGIIKLSPLTSVYVKNYGLCTESWGAPLVNLSFPNMYPLCQLYINISLPYSEFYTTENISLYFTWLKFCTPWGTLSEALKNPLVKSHRCLSCIIILCYHMLNVYVLSNVLILETFFTNFAICRSISLLSQVSGFICWCHNFFMII